MGSYEELLEQYEDAYFALLMYEVDIKEGEKAMKEMEMLENDPQYAVPEETMERCRRLIRRRFAQKRLRRIGGKAKQVVNKVAVVALVAMLCFSTAFAASGSFRVSTLNFLIETFDDRTDFTFLPSAGGGQLGVIFSVDWIPDGYTLVENGAGSMCMWRYYSDTDGHRLEIEVSQSGHQSLSIDTEDNEVVDMTIQGKPGWLVHQKTPAQTILLIADPAKSVYMTIVADEMSDEEIIQVCENICY